MGQTASSTPKSGARACGACRTHAWQCSAGPAGAQQQQSHTAQAPAWACPPWASSPSSACRPRRRRRGRRRRPRSAPPSAPQAPPCCCARRCAAVLALAARQATCKGPGQVGRSGGRHRLDGQSMQPRCIAANRTATPGRLGGHRAERRQGGAAQRRTWTRPENAGWLQQQNCRSQMGARRPIVTCKRSSCRGLALPTHPPPCSLCGSAHDRAPGQPPPPPAASLQGCEGYDCYSSRQGPRNRGGCNSRLKEEAIDRRMWCSCRRRRLAQRRCTGALLQAGQPPRVAVIGGGIAGNAAALALVAKQRVHCTVFDMGRAAGGRVASRQSEHAGLPLSFDHGAQHITAVGPDFKRQLAEWQAAGVLAEWQGRHGEIRGARHCSRCCWLTDRITFCSSITPRAAVRSCHMPPPWCRRRRHVRAAPRPAWRGAHRLLRLPHRPAAARGRPHQPIAGGAHGGAAAGPPPCPPAERRGGAVHGPRGRRVRLRQRRHPVAAVGQQEGPRGSGGAGCSRAAGRPGHV